MIRFDDFKIVPPQRFAGLIARMTTEPPRYQRPVAVTTQDAEAWLHDQPWAAGVSVNVSITAPRLMFVRWLVDEMRLSDGVAS